MKEIIILIKGVHLREEALILPITLWDRVTTHSQATFDKLWRKETNLRLLFNLGTWICIVGLPKHISQNESTFDFAASAFESLGFLWVLKKAFSSRSWGINDKSYHQMKANPGLMLW